LRNYSSGALTTILDADVSFRPQRLKMPLTLSSGTIEELTEVTARVVVEAGGRRAMGQGAVYLSDLWAWPDQFLSHCEREDAMRGLCEHTARELATSFGREPHHPLELGLRIHQLVCDELTISPTPPRLARALCGSPFDAAIHDGVGIALGRSAFSLYDEAVPIPSADQYFPDIGACQAVAEVIERSPKSELPAWYVVCQGDRLDQTLVPAIRQRNYRYFKLKLSGRDVGADVIRTAEVYRIALANGVQGPRLTVDTNEASGSADGVRDFLERLEAADRQAFQALQYLEQPTSRDIRRRPFDWRAVTARKPVLLDEGLTDLDLLEDARQQGYSGLALKTCKGHSMLLAAAAWARRAGMLISLQDLTNPGMALVQAAITGAHLPTVNGAELNSPQFTPAANAEFAALWPGLFEPHDGVHRLPVPTPHGLGAGSLVAA
jgi:L-alanine-DL-glutamate epimerase-like enolase superfamily enzyme